MDERPKCETGIHQNSRGEHRQQLLSRHISKGKGNKSKKELLGLHQDKKLLHSKGNNQKTKRQPTEWKKIFANDTTDKRVVSKIYKELLKLNTRETNNQIKNGQKI